MEDAAHANLMRTIDGIKKLKRDYCLLLADGRHRRQSVKILQNEDEMEWILEQLHMRCTFCVDDMAI